MTRSNRCINDRILRSAFGSQVLADAMAKYKALYPFRYDGEAMRVPETGTGISIAWYGVIICRTWLLGCLHGE